MINEERDIFFLSLQRRQMDRDYMDPIIEVLPKKPLFNLFLEVFIRCHNNSDIGFDKFFAAYRIEPFVLKDSVELLPE